MLSKTKSFVVALILALSLNNFAFAGETGIIDEAPAKPANNDADKKEAVENKSETKSDAKSNPAEVAKTIEALEERIRILEEKLAKMNEPPTAATTAASSTGAPVKPMNEDIKPEMIAELRRIGAKE